MCLSVVHSHGMMHNIHFRFVSLPNKALEYYDRGFLFSDESFRVLVLQFNVFLLGKKVVKIKIHKRSFIMGIV